MKRILSVITVLMIAVALHAQNKDVTKFLGIPVDGTKAEMIQKLRAKGFTSSSYDKDILEGEFNGTDVYIIVVTNNNKVYRIMVSDKSVRNETDIRIRFNDLCQQFQYNSRYTPHSYSQTISDEERISKELTLHRKRYEAIFYQNKIQADTDGKPIPDIMKSVWFMIEQESYNEYKILMYYDNEYNAAHGEDL